MLLTLVNSSIGQLKMLEFMVTLEVKFKVIVIVFVVVLSLDLLDSDGNYRRLLPKHVRCVSNSFTQCIKHWIFTLRGRKGLNEMISARKGSSNLHILSTIICSEVSHNMKGWFWLRIHVCL